MMCDIFGHTHLRHIMNMKSVNIFNMILDNKNVVIHVNNIL